MNEQSGQSRARRFLRKRRANRTDPGPTSDELPQPDEEQVDPTAEPPESSSDGEPEGVAGGSNQDSWLPGGVPAPVREEPRPVETSDWQVVKADEQPPAPPPAVAPTPPAPSSGREDSALAGRIMRLEAEIAELSGASFKQSEADSDAMAELGTRVAALEAEPAELGKAFEQSGQALETARELEQILNLAEAGWRESLLELRARIDIAEERLASVAENEERIRAQIQSQGERSARANDTLSTALRALVGRIETLEKRLGRALELSERVASVERSFGEVDRRARMGDELALALSRYGRPKSAGNSEELEGLGLLNDATFEQLRGLGLSVTQSARLIATRDAIRGFRSVEDLDQLSGFPESKIAELKSLVES